MPIHHAVLAMLAGGSSYGYELKATFEEAIGPQWGELNIGHLYQVLARLVRDGMVTERVIPQARRPDRVMYRLTRRGRDELDAWLESSSLRQGGYRDDFFLKVFAASRLGEDRLRSVLRVQRDAHLAELAALGSLRAQHRGDPLVALLIDAATAHTEANLKMVDTAERRAATLATAAAQTARREPSSSRREGKKTAAR